MQELKVHHSSMLSNVREEQEARRQEAVGDLRQELTKQRAREAADMREVRMA